MGATILMLFLSIAYFAAANGPGDRSWQAHSALQTLSVAAGHVLMLVGVAIVLQDAAFGFELSSALCALVLAAWLLRKLGDLR